ncbi:MAG: hypothetical protein AB1423_11485, partial [Pseudomonadota bacterium]
ASRNGQYRFQQGDFTISPKYYPYIRERKIAEKTKSLSLLGKESFLSYRVLKLSNFYFYPEVDELKIIRMIEPDKKRMVFIPGLSIRMAVLFPTGLSFLVLIRSIK